MSRALADPIGSSFREDAPRPPVPGEEGEAPCHNPGKLATMRAQHKAKSSALASPVAPAKRNEDGLGEPEGSASPDSPLARWTKSLHSLLGDQDGAHLFRIFLERERCVDTLDFWFACNGFRQMDLKDTKTLRVAKAIYKRYIENNSVVAKQLKTATKTYIRDNVKKQQIDSAMFDQAQTEIQTAMEENAYQMFLTSDMYLEYVRAGCENPAHVGPNGLGSLKLMCGYLPTLNEEEEWSCNDFKNKALATSVVGLSAKGLRATACLRTLEALDNGYRSCRRGVGGDPANPRQASPGYAFAPASSANDSEVSSDAMTDDSMSVTDSSVDGIPPYTLGNRKLQQREMQRSMKLNGQVTLPHFPRTRRLPREMTPVEPAAFAAQLASRLERLKREQDSMSSLEERLQQIQEEEEREESEPPVGAAHHPPHPLGALSSPGPGEEDPQAILDEHLSRVLKSPGCQSPGVARHSPRSRSRSPDRQGRGGVGGASGPRVPPPPACSAPRSFPLPACGAGGASGVYLPKQATRHVHHHYIHHRAGPRTQEQVEAEAARRVQSLCLPAVAPGDYCAFPRCRSHGNEPCCSPGETPTSDRRSCSLSKRVCKAGEGGAQLNGEGGRGGVAPLQLPADSTDRSQNVWQWILDSDRQSKHKPHSAQGPKKGCSVDPSCRTSLGRVFTWGGGGGPGLSGHARVHQPSQPFIQDPAMPPLSPPNTLAQLEEACRRLEEVSKPPKQRHSTSSLQRDRPHFSAPPNGNAPSAPAAHVDEPKEPKKAAGCQAASLPGAGAELVVTYFFCGEEIPYRRMMKAHCLTLGHFKEQLQRKGSYRYYFKKASDEFECGAVFEEVWDDRAVLPMFEGRILGKVERME
ncbi:axin-2 [Anguilla anguilla]|uniref:axin-2 n=1 Tax=Anguilla anguilla TaxID=7936 RepID=UPI0015A89F6E|nr:axin-2 [Anguilla anguilla]XP_035254586.1 axin-2 [Anguilla anguilla]